MIDTARALLGRLLDGIAAILAPIAQVLGFRFFYLDGRRIGDLGASLAWLVQGQQLTWIPRFRAVLVPIPTSRLANGCYGEYWRQYVHIASRPVAYRVAFRLARSPELAWSVEPAAHPLASGLDRDSALAASQRQWDIERRPPLFRLTAEHELRGREALTSLGMDPDAWFVALHVREPGYLGEQADSYRMHRNADVHTYLHAAEEITRRGGWVIRMGDPSMQSIAEMERVIDYVHSPVYSDWMDVFLAASCRFFLGSSSGLFVVAWSFGRPCALANWNSLITRPWGRGDIFIPKLWWLRSENRHLTWAEQLEAPYVRPLYLARTRPDEFARLGLSVVDSSPGEIVEVVEEMFLREDGVPLSEEETELHASFERIVARFYPYGTSARLGTAFLRQHRGLLQRAGAV